MKSLLETRKIVASTLNDYVKQSHITRDIEKSIVNYTVNQLTNIYKKKEFLWSDITTRRLYLRKYRQIKYNIHALLELISRNQLKPIEVANIHPHKIRPDIWNVYYDALKLKEANTMLEDGEDDQFEGLLICDQCKSKKTRYVTLQTRSSDEPTTIYARCLNCSHRWSE